jgi:hypothetical protein
MSKAQNDMIAEHLKSGRRITPLEALRLYGCMRLGARIYELRRKPYHLQIQSEAKRVAKNKTVSEYYLIPPDKQQLTLL